MSEVRNADKPGKVFYGWVLVLILVLLLSVGTGTSMYMYSVVANTVGEEFGASRSILMLGSSGLLLFIGLCSPTLGRMFDSYSGKAILAIGAAVMGLGFIAVAVSTSIWTVILAYVVLIGTGAAVLSPLAAATLLSRWFTRRRGLAIGIATVGTQLGGFVFPPVIASAMELYSWRLAIGALGGGIMLFLPLLIWFSVSDKPKESDDATDVAASRSKPAIEKSVGLLPSLPSLLFQGNVLFLVCIVGVTIATNTVLLMNLSMFATDLGESPVRGAFLVSAVAFVGLIFSPIMGWLCDEVNIKFLASALVLLLAASCLTFAFAFTYPMLLVAACIQGIGGAGVFPMWTAMVGKLCTTNTYGRMMGVTTLVVAIFTAAAPLLAGWIYDVSQSYRWLFFILVVLLVSLLPLIAFIRFPDKEIASNAERVPVVLEDKPHMA